MTTVKEGLKSEKDNITYDYLDDSDFLSSDDQEDGYFSEDNYLEETPLIDSIINKHFNTFLKLLKTSENELVYDNEIERKINPLQVALKYYKDYNDINYITKLLEYYNETDGILFSVFNMDCYNYYKNKEIDIYNYQDKLGDNLILWATRYSNLKMVYDIYENLVDKSITNLLGLNCFLSTALNCNSNNIFEISNFLYDKNNDFINSIDKNDDNFLMLLENNNRIKANDKNKSIIVKFLVDNGIDINHINKQGKNILMILIENSNCSTWKYLMDYVYFYIRKDINLEHCDNNNEGILNYCIQQIENEIKISNKKNQNNLKKDFSYLREIINLIIKSKSVISEEDKILLKNFKLNMMKNKMI